MKFVRILILALIYGVGIGLIIAAALIYGAMIAFLIGFFVVPFLLIVTGMLLRNRANGGSLFGRKKKADADKIDAGFECPYCGARFPFARKSCPTCGKDLNQRPARRR